MGKMIYLDHAATTGTKDEVLAEMMPYFGKYYGNASSIYSFASESRKALAKSREVIAGILNASPDEIYFTASGTEADNFAVIGCAKKAFRDSRGAKRKIITSAIEHHAVLHTCQYLEKDGYEVVYVPVDEYGITDLDRLAEAIDDKTALITVMYANNEVGTIQPVKEIGKLAKASGVVFHTDAVQAAGAIPIDVRSQGIDMLSMSAHKFGGPKGVGALYIRKGIKIDPYLHGGAQERKKRAGTENVAAIAGMAKAFEIAAAGMRSNGPKIAELRDYTIKMILNGFEHVKLNGHPVNRLPNNINISFEFIEGEGLLLLLDSYGIMASSGSACTSGSLDPSHVLIAMGLSHETAHGSLRLTLGEETTKEDMDYTIEKLKIIVQKLRMMSPLYNG
jgi:cysteine desulfurase